MKRIVCFIVMLICVSLEVSFAQVPKNLSRKVWEAHERSKPKQTTEQLQSQNKAKQQQNTARRNDETNKQVIRLGQVNSGDYLQGNGQGKNNDGSNVNGSQKKNGQRITTAKNKSNNNTANQHGNDNVVANQPNVNRPNNQPNVNTADNKEVYEYDYENGNVGGNEMNIVVKMAADVGIIKETEPGEKFGKKPGQGSGEWVPRNAPISEKNVKGIDNKGNPIEVQTVKGKPYEKVGGQKSKYNK